jgi:hypothetical protein
MRLKSMMKIKLNINGSNLERFITGTREKCLVDGKKEYRYFELSEYQIKRVLLALEEYTKELDNEHSKKR